MNESALWALLAALCYGIAPVFEKIGLQQAQPTAAVFVRALITAVFTGITLTTRDGWTPLANWTLKTWLAIMMSGIVGVLLAQVFYFAALRMGDVGRVAPIAGSYPLFACLLAAICLGERLTPGRVLGAALVFLGVLFLS
ncbi:MAG: EamA family transporter [Firmicutes bacterium]|nr:EamA family transporter [Bacillota bacterium]